MLYVTKKVREIQKGPAVYRVVFDDRASAEEAEVIRKVVDMWLAGKIEPVREKKIGYAAVPRKIVREVKVVRKEDGVRAYRYEERPLGNKDIVQASLWTVSPTGLAYDPETHEEVHPTVAVIGPDGSAVWLRVPDDLAAGVSAAEPEIIEDEAPPPPPSPRKGRKTGRRAS